MSDPRPTRSDPAVTTRTRVIESAKTLFMTQGFAATTTRQIAANAGVTERTLFNIVPSKGDLLQQVLLTYVFINDFGPLLQRKDFAPVLRAAAVADFLTEYSRWVTALHVSTAEVVEMIRSAAPIDQGAAELWALGHRQEITDLRNLATTLHRRDWLRSDLGVAEAAQSLAVLSGHETYWRLVSDLRWSRARYRRWLHRHCALELRTSAGPTVDKGV